MVLNSAIDAIPVPVANGGTGAATLTGVLTGNGTSAVTANAVTQNGVLYGGASNAVSSLAVASTGQIMTGVSASAPAFSSTPTIGLAADTTTSTLGASTAGQTISIQSAASNTGANVVNILNGATPGANTTLNVMNGAGTAGTQTINMLATGATRAGAVNVATGAAAHTVAIGSASAGAITVDTAAGISLDAATASNFTVTGAGADLTLQGVGGSVVIASNEAVANAVGITASDATGGITLTAGTGNINNAAISVVQSLSSAGNNVNNQVTNSDNTNAASHASYQLATGGAAGGDPYINFLVSGAGVFSLGIDNTDSDIFKLSANASLGTSDVMTITSAGAVVTAAGITATTGNITSTAGSLVCSAAGQGVQVNPSTNTPGASPQIVNAIHGQVAFTDVVANGAYGTLTLTNSEVTSGSYILASASCTTANSAIQIVDIVPGSGSVAMRLYNAGSASTATSILINFWVMN